jgi:hypothetical protein
MSNETSPSQPYSTSEQKPGKRRGVFSSPVALILASSIFFVLIMIGHISAYPWSSSQAPRERQLVGAMKSTDFIFVGQHSSYWNLYLGWGTWLAVLLLTFAIILWILSGIARLAPRPVGMICGVLSATCLIGAYISFLYFYTPPSVMLLVMFVILLTAAVQLLRRAS